MEVVNSILLALILLCFLAFLATTYVFVRRIRGIYAEFQGFIAPEGDGKPSQLAAVSEALSEMIGRAIVASLRGFLMGQKSLEVRQANAETSEQIGESPLGGIVNLLPKSLKKSLIKNPQLLDMAINYMQRQGTRGNNGHSGAVSSPVKFKL